MARAWFVQGFCFLFWRAGGGFCSPQVRQHCCTWGLPRCPLHTHPGRWHRVCAQAWALSIPLASQGLIQWLFLFSYESTGWCFDMLIFWATASVFPCLSSQRGWAPGADGGRSEVRAGVCWDWLNQSWGNTGCSRTKEFEWDSCLLSLCPPSPLLRDVPYYRGRRQVSMIIVPTVTFHTHRVLCIRFL